MVDPHATTPQRRNASLLSGPERRLLHYLVVRVPRSVTPDHLTALGVAGAFVAGGGFVLGWYGSGWLWLAIVGLAIHWFGDSLDGTLARHRRTERARYGLMLDQSIDTLGNLAIAVGVGLSPWARLDLALLVLAAYHMLAIGALLRSIVDGEFHIDIAGFGPTEMRVGIAALALSIIVFGAPPIAWLPITMSWCDLVLLALFVLLILLFVTETLRTLRRLSAETADELKRLTSKYD